jgi:hypothetical protein
MARLDVYRAHMARYPRTQNQWQQLQAAYAGYLGLRAQGLRPQDLEMTVHGTVAIRSCLRQDWTRCPFCGHRYAPDETSGQHQAGCRG